MDYWRPLRAGLTQLTLHGTSAADARQYVEDNAFTNVRGNPENCIDRFDKISTWAAKQSGNLADSPQRGVWTSPNELFSVHIEPDFTILGRDNARVVSCYPTDAPQLSRDTAGSGIILLRRFYGEASNYSFQIYDVNRNRCYKSPTNISESLLTADIDDIERHFRANQ
jgi:hypothetical protein